MMHCRDALVRYLAVIRKLRAENDGVAAIEFAFIAPIMLTMMFGVFEIGRAYAAHRRFIHVSYMVGDLITREEKLTSDQLNGIYALITPAMGSYPVSTLQIDVVPLFTQAAAPDKPLIYAAAKRWNGTAAEAAKKARCATYSLSSDRLDVLKNSPAGLILITANYTFNPIFNYPGVSSLLANVNWTSEAMFSPRQSCVGFDGVSCVNSCP